MPDLSRLTDIELANAIASGTVPLAEAIELDAQKQTDLAADDRTPHKSLITTAKYLVSRGRFGRVCGILVVGYIRYGDQFLSMFDNERILSRSGAPQSLPLATRAFSKRLSAVGGFEKVVKRLDTYTSFAALEKTAECDIHQATPILRRRPFLHARALLLVANYYFLRRYHRFPQIRQLEALIEGFETPEELAAAVSAVLAESGRHAHLEAADISQFHGDSTGLLFDHDLASLLRYGRTICDLTEIGDLVSVFGYNLEPIASSIGLAFLMTEPFEGLEYSIRLGFIRAEIGSGTAVLHVGRDSSNAAASIATAVDSLSGPNGVAISEVAEPDTPRRRVRLRTPLVPGLLRQMSQFHFYEDLVNLQTLAQEWDLPLGLATESEWEVVDGLSLSAFLRGWRGIRLLCLLDLSAISQHHADPTLVTNSLLRVMSREQHTELLGLFGLDEREAESFMRLVCLDLAKPTRVDLQYQPLVLVKGTTLGQGEDSVTSPEEVMYGQGLIASSNFISNVLRCHGVRSKGNPSALVEATASLLREITPLVTTNRPIKNGAIKTEVDVVALVGQTLYLIECKHSVTATDVHEMRDLWRDVRKGVSQLKRATAIMTVRCKPYLSGWFPNGITDISATFRIQPLVICSHRLFSGLAIDSVPIRDHASLSTILSDGVVQVGTIQTGTTVSLNRFRLRDHERASQDDLDDYLSVDSRYFRMFRQQMRTVRVRRGVAGGAVEKDTFSFQADPESIERGLEQLGARRLTADQVEIGPTVENQ